MGSFSADLAVELKQEAREVESETRFACSFDHCSQTNG
jgi:hypothetical protein